MQNTKDRAAKLYNISPRSTKQTVSPLRCLPSKQQLQKAIPKRTPIFKVQQHQSQAQPASSKIQLGRLHTLGDELSNPFEDDYETPKFNAEKEFKFGNTNDKFKKEGDFFSFGLTKKQPNKEITKSKGKENSSLIQKESVKGVNKIMKGSPHNSKATIFIKKDSKDSISPRRKIS